MIESQIKELIEMESKSVVQCVALVCMVALAIAAMVYAEHDMGMLIVTGVVGSLSFIIGWLFPSPVAKVE